MSMLRLFHKDLGNLDLRNTRINFTCDDLILPFLRCYREDLKDKEEAEKKLENCSVGTYIIRNSDNAGHHIVSYVSEKGKVTHEEIYLLKKFPTPTAFSKNDKATEVGDLREFFKKHKFCKIQFAEFERNGATETVSAIAPARK